MSKLSTMPKKLYKASNMNELKDMAQLNSVKWRDKSDIKMVISKAEKLLEAAKTSMKTEEPDEEHIYILLFRSRELWDLAASLKEFKADRRFYKAMYMKPISGCQCLLEKYNNNLELRYKELKSNNNKNDETSQFNLVTSLPYKKRKEVDTSNSKSSLSNGLSYSTRSSEEHTNESDMFDIAYIPPTSKLSDTDDYYGGKKFIECEDLKEVLLIHSLEILVLDTRPKEHFEQSKILKVRNINIPKEYITAGLSANKLSLCITDSEERGWWNRRGEYRQVVLLDWHSEVKDIIPSCTLSNLYTILMKWDTDVVYKRPPLILNGGFEKWLDMYPTLTTSPKICCPPKPEENSFIQLSEHNIDYPFSELEEPKAPKPVVDRTTKPEILVPNQQLENTPSVSEGPVIMNISPKSQDKEKKEEDEKQADVVPVTQNTERVVTPWSETPPKLVDKPQPTPTKSTIGQGDNGDYSFEQLNSTPRPRSGGSLKRASSSPNINKLVSDDSDNSSLLSLPKDTPTFDRSTKPSHRFDDFISRSSNMDTIYQHGKKGRGLTGLKNLGNLCYMNSVMQCISNTVELTADLTRFSPKEEVNTRRRVVGEVSALLRILWQGDTRVINCRELKTKVGALKHSFSTFEQQDSHEFLTLLLDWLHEDLNKPCSPASSLRGADEATGEKAWGEFREKNNSVIVNLFYGQLKSTVTCSYCQKSSILFEPFSNLSIPLPANYDALDRRFSLQECLKLYLVGETITGWICPNCKTSREATKKLDITRLPPMLIIHLKRFMTDLVGVGWIRKRMNMVDFPISDFNMKPYTLPDSELRFHSYNLYAVSNHYGSMESGHYTAYCKNHLLNKWYKFDDPDVNEISPAEVKSAAAYILFYESTSLDRSRHID